MADLAHLIDLQDIASLKGIEIGADTVSIGAMVTQHELITDEGLAEALPLIREAALQIADPQVRYVGTVGGNVANGDPGNDMPGLMQCLDATYDDGGPGGSRQGPPRATSTSRPISPRGRTRNPDPRITAFRVPPPARATPMKSRSARSATMPPPPPRRWSDAWRAGLHAASIAMTNLSDTPVWSEAAGAALVGTAVRQPRCRRRRRRHARATSTRRRQPRPVDFKRHVAGVICAAPSPAPCLMRTAEEDTAMSKMHSR
jgi:carbon-monoxide dehydrogenase medium subunit